MATTRTMARLVPAPRESPESTQQTTQAHARSASRDFLTELNSAVREQLQHSQALPDFLAGAGTLSPADRRTLVTQALLLFEQHYVHLPLKVAMHGINPVQRLRLLDRRLERAVAGSEQVGPEWQFHAELLEIFHSVRDLHTNYVLPAPFNTMVAYLPFMIEEYFTASVSHFVVSAKVGSFTAPGFEPGATVTHWNGIPIARAVDLQAARFAGSNPAARHSRGLQSITIRPLRVHLPPDEEWVTLGYTGLDGKAYELQQNWLVAENLPSMQTTSPAIAFAERAEVYLGVDLDGDEVNRARKLLFAPSVVAQEQAISPTGRMPKGAMKTVAAGAGQEFPTRTPGVFRARSVRTPSGTFGHIRIFTFSVSDPQAFLTEFIRLLGVVPAAGLILDVRGNGGGHIHASEFALQTLTPRTITPEPVQFISTALNLAICRGHADDGFGVWLPSLDQAAETGSVFSGAYPITPVDGANAVGQQYFGPVVLITDARCYSATDIFAAGFADHRIGRILGVDANTGAGGANVWTHSLIRDLFENPGPGSAPSETSPYLALPGGADMRVSIRRTLRVGELAGTPVEDLGVIPDELHRLTRNDVLSGNVDLLARAGELLSTMPVHAISGTASLSDSGITLALDLTGVDRVDVFLDGRPQASHDAATGPVIYTIPYPTAEKIVVRGYLASELVVVRTLTL